VNKLFESLADVIEGQIRDRRLRWMVGIPSGVAAIIVGIGWVFGLPVVVNVTLVCVSVFLALTVVCMAISRRYMRRSLGRTYQILNRYGDRIRDEQERDKNLFHTTAWREEVRVGKDGDTTIIRFMTLQAGPGPVSAVWTLASRNSPAHLSEQVKEAVRVNANFLDEEDVVGTSIVTTTRWEGERFLRIYMYFDRDLAADSTTMIRLQIKWPKYSADLLDGIVEPSTWIFRRPTSSLKVATAYDKVFAPTGVRVTPLVGSVKPTITQDEASGSTHVRFELDDIEVDREYGYRVELIRSSSD